MRVGCVALVLGLVLIAVPPPVAAETKCDQGISTRACAEVTMIPLPPESEGTCHFRTLSYGEVFGSVPEVNYAWSIPGDSGSAPGPVARQNTLPQLWTLDLFESVTVTATASISTQLLGLDEAVAVDRKEFICQLGSNGMVIVVIEFAYGELCDRVDLVTNCPWDDPPTPPVYTPGVVVPVPEL